MEAPGWRALQGPRLGAEAFAVSPFARLARAHALLTAGDTLVAIALAGSLFFSIDPGAARSKVFLYLAVTMAPFAVVAPLVGPTLDRVASGRRLMVVASGALRAVVCLLMIDDIDSFLFFPEAFALLVLAKSYAVAKSALVPTVVRRDDELVEANSKLSLISGLVGVAAAVPGALLYRLGGSPWVLGLTVVVFGAGAFFALGIPGAPVATQPESEVEREELRGAAVLLAATAMAVLRGVVGFMMFLVAFALRSDGAPSWHFGVLLAVSAAGALVGAAIAPSLRRSFLEERIIAGDLVVVAVVAAIGAWVGGLVGAVAVAAAVGVSASSARLAFDAIVQRDAPDANRGRSFARFETRFQLAWVGGAVLGVVPQPMRLGFGLVAAVAVVAAISYVAGGRTVRAAFLRRVARRARRDHGRPAAGELPPTIVTPEPVSPPAPPPPPPPPPALPPTIVAPGPDLDVTLVEREDAGEHGRPTG